MLSIVKIGYVQDITDDLSLCDFMKKMIVAWLLKIEQEQRSLN